MSLVKVLSIRTGRVLLIDETLANTYYRLDGRYVVGSPVNDAAAYRKSFLGGLLAPVAPINWKAFPAIPAGSTPYQVDAGYYRNDDPSATLVQLPYQGRKVVLIGTGNNPLVLRSRGHLIGGYSGRVYVQGVRLEAANPGVFGQSAGRAVNMDELLSLEFYENVLLGTSGILAANYHKTGWAGDYNSGDRVCIERNYALNIRGQCSDGSYDPANPLDIKPVQSNFVETHPDSVRWNPAVAAADRTEANKADPAKFGQLGSHSVQFVMIRTLGKVTGGRICDNIVVNEFGRSRQEDAINFYGGSGGTPASRFLVQGNFIKNGQGLDWNYVPGAGVAYDGTNQVTKNATSYQNPSQTYYSGSGGIVDAFNPDASTNGVWDQAGYIDWFDHTVLGHIVSHQAGHDCRYRRIAVYQTVVTDAGDPLVMDHSGFQWTNYGGDARAKDASGTLQYVWQSNEASNLTYYGGATAKTMDDSADMKLRGGIFDLTTNKVQPRPAAGFEAQLVANWRAAKANAGLFIPSA